MDSLLDALRDPWILAYLALVFAGQWTVRTQQRAAERVRALRRREAGLADEVLADPAAKLEWFRTWAIRRLGALLSIGILFPIVILTISGFIDIGDTDGLLVAFVAVIVFAVWNATDVVRSWLSGVAFEALIAGAARFSSVIASRSRVMTVR